MKFTNVYLFICTLLISSGCSQLIIRENSVDNEWEKIFDTDSSLNNFTQYGSANWRILDGNLQADQLISKTPAYLVTKTSYSNFKLYAEIWVDHETNSGFFLRCSDINKIGADTCYEFNIWYSRPDPTFGTGAIVDVAKVSPMPKIGGHWSTIEIEVNNDLLVFKINGSITSSASSNLHNTGKIALQYGSGIVKFRKILIKKF
jgi:Domain of Unknown Function (DUF1080)